jgi:hypothetical protein
MERDLYVFYLFIYSQVRGQLQPEGVSSSLQCLYVYVKNNPCNYRMTQE